jgi:hypothetical protein
VLRAVHDAIGLGELACLGYPWFCGVAADATAGWGWRRSCSLRRALPYLSPMIVRWDPFSAAPAMTFRCSSFGLDLE